MTLHRMLGPGEGNQKFLAFPFLHFHLFCGFMSNNWVVPQ